MSDGNYQLRKPPVVILSTGRAGSTLLQKLLNTHSELTIFGEHAGFLTGIMAAWQAVAANRWIPEKSASGRWLIEDERPVNAEKWTAWDGSFSKIDFQHYLRNFLDQLFSDGLPPERRWGFKEIRYNRPGFIDFFLSIYPEALFILLMRNPIDACISFTSAFVDQNELNSFEFRAQTQKIAETQIKPFFPFFHETVARHPTRATTVLFEKLVASPMTCLEQVGDFLGLHAAFDKEAVEQIMAKDIISQRRRSDPERMGVLQDFAAEALAAEAEWYATYLMRNKTVVSE